MWAGVASPMDKEEDLSLVRLQAIVDGWERLRRLASLLFRSLKLSPAWQLINLSWSFEKWFSTFQSWEVCSNAGCWDFRSIGGLGGGPAV